MNLRKTLADIKRQLAGATATIESELKALRQRITETHRKLAHAQNAPRPLEEVIAERIPKAVREAGAHWLKERGSSLIRGDYSLGSTTPGSVRLPWLPSEAPPWGAWCASDPDGAAEFLARLVRQVEYEAGPASAERPAVVQQLEAELAELEAAEEAMVDEMRAEGLNVEHRPEVVQRREQERHRRQREAQAAADRAAREAALDAAHAEREGRRAAPSPYLAANRPRGQ